MTDEEKPKRKRTESKLSTLCLSKMISLPSALVSNAVTIKKVITRVDGTASQNVFYLDEITFKVSFLLEPSLWINPDLPDDLASGILWVEAEKRCNPGDRLPLVRGCPHVPADQVVQQEWEQHQSPPAVVGCVDHV